MKQRARDKPIKGLALILSLGTFRLTTGNLSLAAEENTLPEWDKPGSLNLSRTASATR